MLPSKVLFRTYVALLFGLGLVLWVQAQFSLRQLRRVRRQCHRLDGGIVAQSVRNRIVDCRVRCSAPSRRNTSPVSRRWRAACSWRSRSLVLVDIGCPRRLTYTVPCGRGRRDCDVRDVEDQECRSISCSMVFSPICFTKFSKRIARQSRSELFGRRVFCRPLRSLSNDDGQHTGDAHRDGLS